MQNRGRELSKFNLLDGLKKNFFKAEQLPSGQNTGGLADKEMRILKCMRGIISLFLVLHDIQIHIIYRDTLLK